MTTAPMSLAAIEQMLENRKVQLLELAAKRDKLQKELDDIDNQIQGLAGGCFTSRKRRRFRMKNEKSLKALVTDILGKHKSGFSLADLADKVRETGYKSASRNFRNVLYQSLYNSPNVAYDEATRRYSLSK